MDCIFSCSKYYPSARADPFQIAAPLGYQFLQRNKKSYFAVPAKAGDLVIKYVYDKANHKVLSSQRRTPLEKLEEALKISELSTKADYVSTSCLEFINKSIDPETVETLASKFMPNAPEEFAVVELAHIISDPRVQSLLHIEDYALSRFIFFYEGSNEHKVAYMAEFFTRRIIEYPLEVEVAEWTPSRGRFEEKKLSPWYLSPPQNVCSVSLVKEYIERVNSENKKKDPLYSGVHFYFGDYAKRIPESISYFKREMEHIHVLQYYVTVLTGILADGQTAILKLCGSFRHKTFEYLYMLKLVFSKVSLTKTFGSNPFTPDSYLVCEYFNKSNGNSLHKHLIDNYHMLSDFGEEKLLVDPKKIFREDAHNSLTKFNDSIILLGLQNCFKDYLENSNIEFYPNKIRTKEKLPTNFCANLQSLVETAIKERSEQAKNGPAKESLKVEKEADYNMLEGISRKPRQIDSKKTEQPKNTLTNGEGSKSAAEIFEQNMRRRQEQERKQQKWHSRKKDKRRGQ